MLVLIFGAIVCFTTGTLINDVGECGYPTKMYNLNSGDLMKVQSPQFPKSLTSPQSSTNISCSMTFKRTDQKNNGLQFIFTNGYTVGYLFNDQNGLMKPQSLGKNSNDNDKSTFNFYDSNDNVKFLNAKNQQSFTYSYGSVSGGFQWSAFEAFVYAPEDNEQSNSCWMNDKTFDLIDDSKTIPLFIAQDLANFQNCSWTVNVPDGMAMKMTIPFFWTYGSSSQIRVYPDGGDYISLGQGISQTFYGKSFVIQMLATGAMKFESNFNGFYALVSAVSKTPPIVTEFQCTKTVNKDQSYNIGFYDPQNGYPNSAVCKVPLSSPSNTALIFQPQTRYMEYLGEWLQIHDDQDFIIGGIMGYNIFSGENVGNWSLQFVTDENNNGAGFSVREFYIDCECAANEFTVQCDGRSLVPIMTADTNSTTQIYTYCRGMNCSYKILPNNDCIDKKIEIDIELNISGTFFDDNITLNVDGNQIWNNTNINVFTGLFDQTKTIEINLASVPYGKYGLFSQMSTLMLAVTAMSRNMTNATTPSPTTCSRNAIQSVDKSQCFLVIQGNKTFIEAEADCKTYGGHLASIHNAFDNYYIYDYARTYYGISLIFLIGANDLTVEGQWNWIDGTVFDFNDFRGPFLSDSQDCAVMESMYGLWEQVDCYKGFNYICATPGPANKK